MAKRKPKPTSSGAEEAAPNEPDLAEGALTPKMEAFIAAYFETGNASEAYRRAYNAENMAPETIHVKACELLKHGKVAARIAELKRVAAKRAVVTVETIMDELAQAWLLALQLEQPSTMVTASMGRAKVSGLVVDKKEVGAPGEFQRLTDEELQARAIAMAERLSLSAPRRMNGNGSAKH